MRRLLLLAVLLALSPISVRAADWPTYHGDNTRQGNDSSDPGLASASPTWAATLDGNIYGQPVVIGSQVIVATENNTVYSLDAASGGVQWSRHLGAPRRDSFPCGNINPLGITGTPVVDSGAVYVVANIEISTGSFFFELASLSLGTGAPLWTRNINPPDPQWNAGVEQQRGALLVAAGRVFVPLGGLSGDCGQYHGYVVSFPETGPGGSLQWWAAAEVVPGERAAGVWATGGLSEDTSGFIYAPTGNSIGNGGATYDYSDGIIKLNPNSLTPGVPVDFFAPSTWMADNAADADLGSTSPLQLPNGRIFIIGKSGVGYLLNTANLGHVGGQLAQHRICSATNGAVFGSLAYTNGVVYASCRDGLAAIQITSGSNDFARIWYNTNPAQAVDHPPTIAGGLVWAVTPNGANLAAFDPNTGQQLQSFPIGTSSHFATPTAANGQLYLAGGSVVHAFASCLGSSFLGDFTGDRKADLSEVSGTGSCVLASSGAGFAAPSPWATAPFYGTRATLSADVTGDGRTDLVAVNEGSAWVMASTGTGFSGPAMWSGTPFFGSKATLAADVNGDGRSDLVAVNQGSTWVMLATPSGFSGPVPWSGAPFYGSKVTLIGDINGDGRADLIAVNEGSTWVMLSSGAGFSAPQLWSGSPFYGSKATLVGDVTGDGRSDLIAVNDGSQWVMTSTGSRLSAPQLWSSNAFFGDRATLAGDATGDGFCDLVAVNSSGVWVMASSGAGFGAPAIWWTGPP